jgi:hypothetical protein
MTINTARREFTWTAMTCRLEKADIYIGLAAGLDDFCALRFPMDQVAAFPMQRIKVTSANGASMPLRFYSVRDPSIVQVQRAGRPSREKDFEVVRLTFQMPKHADMPSLPHQGAAPPSPVEPVMGFLVTIGLQPHEEEAFFTTVVSEFLDRSWMTLPQLLREIGCADPAHMEHVGEACG